MPPAALNSVVTALIAATIAALLTVAVSAATVRGPRWTRWIDGVAMGPLGVSAVVIGLGMLLTLNRNVAGVDLRTSWLLVPLAQAIVALPLAVRILVPATRAIDPRLRAAAASLGASPWRVWRSIDARLLRGPVALAAGFAFAIAMGEFGATAFVARPDRPTLPLAIARLLSRPGAQNVGMGFAAAVLLGCRDRGRHARDRAAPHSREGGRMSGNAVTDSSSATSPLSTQVNLR